MSAARHLYLLTTRDQFKLTHLDLCFLRFCLRQRVIVFWTVVNDACYVKKLTKCLLGACFRAVIVLFCHRSGITDLLPSFMVGS